MPGVTAAGGERMAARWVTDAASVVTTPRARPHADAGPSAACEYKRGSATLRYGQPAEL